MSSELVPSPTGTIIPGLRPKEKYRKLARNAIKTAFKASDLLPAVVDEIEARLSSTDKNRQLDNKSLIAAGSFLERLSAHRLSVAKAAGLAKYNQPNSAPSSVTINMYGDLPIAERIKRIEAEVSNSPNIEPKRISPQASQAQILLEPRGSVSEGVTAPADSEVAPTPENAAASVSGGQAGVPGVRVWRD